MIMVSACLMGKKCRYDGGAKPCSAMMSRLEGEELLLVCPEADAGMTIPRQPCEIIGGTGEDVLAGRARVKNARGEDMTELYVKGAMITLEKAKKYKPERIILKSKSPSCGCGCIHDGRFNGGLIKGDGVTAALLKKNGFAVQTEKEDRHG